MAPSARIRKEKTKEVKQKKDFLKGIGDAGKKKRKEKIKPAIDFGGHPTKPASKPKQRENRTKLAARNLDENIPHCQPVVSASSDEDELQDALKQHRTTQRAHRLLKSERLKRTLFVGNLPLTVKRKDLERLFNRVLNEDSEASAVGCRVESVRLRGFVPSSGGTGKLARKRAVIQGETPAGVSRTLIAYVVLTSAAGVRPALTLNGHWLNSKPSDCQTTGESADFNTGKYIRVDCAGSSSTDVGSCVFLGNLPFDVVEDEVRDALSKFGEISNVRLIRDRETGAVKGFGYVQFKYAVSVSLAVRSSEMLTIRNRSVRIEEWRDPSKKKQKKNKVKFRSATVSKPKVTKAKLAKVNHTGHIKGITLPSNVRGAERERLLQKRLLKKRKRQLRRQQQHANLATGDLTNVTSH